MNVYFVKISAKILKIHVSCKKSGMFLRFFYLIICGLRKKAVPLPSFFKAQRE